MFNNDMMISMTAMKDCDNITLLDLAICVKIIARFEMCWFHSMVYDHLLL